jgi:hypothetical protein
VLFSCKGKEMLYFYKKFLPAVLIMLFATITSVHATTKGRIMTNGKVTLIKNGQTVSTYTEQGPLDENALISCDGTCMVKLQGISLSAVDQTKFALKDSADSINLFVDSGKIYFVVTDITQHFAFYSPNSYYVRTEGFIAPASTDSAVKGFIVVKDKTTEIGMDTGSMIIQTSDGTQTVNPGQTIVLAMADVPDDENSTEEKDSGDESENDAEDKAGGFAWENLSDNPQLTTLVVGVGVVGVGLGAALLWHNTNDADGGEPPPPPPEPPSPPPASRNR